MKAAYLVDGVRTPIGNFGGTVGAVRPDDMAALVLKEVLARNPSVDPAAIADVILGCANQAGEDNRNVARMAALLAGLPPSVPGVSVNRLCASGLDAVGAAGVSYQDVVDVLETEGLEKFEAAWDELLGSVRSGLDAHR